MRMLGLAAKDARPVASDDTGRLPLRELRDAYLLASSGSSDALARSRPSATAGPPRPQPN